MILVEANSIVKSYGSQKVLNGLSFNVETNEIVAIMGKSGTGKSTLLNILGLLDKPDHGDLTLFGLINVRPFSSKASNILRNKIGFLFQNFALIDNKTVEYNIALALKNRRKINKADVVAGALKKVGLEGFEKKYIYQCSGGEQQRIAVARLLLKPCELVLADEPTGSLDLQNRDEIIRLLLLLKEVGKTVIIVTHDPTVASRCDRTIFL
ncbi:MAG TPA: bacteriocin ABC transporter ATP-binding protein [Erysipelotrichaceae bacterium]|nr:MAG: bacteriocin ABC transporter ATP-binding protein [Firmicutes bacterium GWE2_51_13]HBZ42429.1 bacteriocin ABC transporter ATP-binding protein [Erysipelotrichaceae bacterium]